MFTILKKNFIIIAKYKWQIYIYIFLIQILSIINTFTSILFPGYLIDFLSQNEFKKSIYLVIIFITIELISFFLIKIFNIKKNESYAEINIKLQQKIYDKSIEIKYQNLEKNQTLVQFDAARKCISQNLIEDSINNIIEIITSFVSLIGILYIFQEISWIIKIIIICLIAIHCGICLKNTATEIKEFDDSNEIGRKINYARFWLPEKSFAKEIRSYQLQNYIVNKLDLHNQENYNLMSKYLKKYNKTNFISNILIFIQIVSIYGYTIYLYSIGNLAISDFIIYSTALFRLLGLINGIISQSIGIHKAISLLKKFHDFINIDNQSKKTNSINISNIETIEFKNVYFKYDGKEDYALKNINLKISAKDKIAIVGDNGAGKSTLIKLLLKLYEPTSGNIYLNGINIKNLDFKDYISKISTIFQDYTIFNFTIKENIGMGKNIDENKMNHILKSLEFYQDLNLGITTLFHENGIELSGGESQKLAIARALYKDSPMIILDEPTSSLSPQSEAEIYNQFLKSTTNKTIVFISHRLSSCKMVDRIIVMSDGKIIEEGPHKALLKKKGFYSKMFHLQAKMYIDS